MDGASTFGVNYMYALPADNYLAAGYDAGKIMNFILRCVTIDSWVPNSASEVKNDKIYQRGLWEPKLRE